MRASSTSEFLANPIGKYVSGPTWLYFADQTLAGCAVWGRLGADDVATVLRLVSLWLEPGMAPRGSYFDMRGVEPGGAIPVFPLIASFIQENRRLLSQRVTKFSVVLGDGFTRVLARGFWSVVSPPYPLRLFQRPLQALQWVGHPRAKALTAELETIQAEVQRTAPIRHQLQATFAGRLRDITLSRAARELGLSVRTLQRRLRESDTSFERELGQARVATAQTLMLDSDASLTAIAYDVGCASPAHFSVLFRKVSGETPSRWRERHARTGEPLVLSVTR